MKKSLLFAVLCLCSFDLAQAQNWPSFRGPNATGISNSTNLPANWDAEKSQNTRWKTPIPGLSHASPIVWGDRVFVTTTVSSQANLKFDPKSDAIDHRADLVRHSYRVFCLDKNTGRILWERTAYEGVPKIKRHPKASHANATPATDGRYVVANFGNEGLYCYDLDGKLIWKQTLGFLDPGLKGEPDEQWSYASSPIIYRDLVIVQCDIQKDSFLAAFNVQDGRQAWRVAREEWPSWATPVIYEGKNRTELITNSPRHLRAHDPLTGKELWRFREEIEVKSPTPVVAGDLVYFSGGYPLGRPINILRPGGNGDISLKQGETKNDFFVAAARSGPYTPTPIVIGEYLYSCNDRGLLICYNARTGEQIYQARVGEKGATFSASPVAADGKLFLASEDGDVYVVKPGPKYELLAVNPMGEVCMATPAIADNTIFVRTQNHLVAIGQPRKTAQLSPNQAPGQVIDAMTAAWNAHDAVQFASFLHPEIELKDVGRSEVIRRGRQAFLESAAGYFRKHPKVRVEILKRIADGPFVIDQEKLSGLEGQPDKVQTVILEVRDGLVVRLWGLPEDLK
ncbi:MAG TPA: PQQ-binding-like beta-propeller repeat protein [Blastocatellia bacterium]